MEKRQTSPVRIAANHRKPGTIHHPPSQGRVSTLPPTNSSEDGWLETSLSFWGFDPLSRALAVSFSEYPGKLKTLAGISPP